MRWYDRGVAVMGKLKQDSRPLGSPKSWAKTPGTYISAQAYIDGADHAAVMAETKWGVDRLRLLVTPELRDKFDRQRYLTNAAIWHGDLEDIRRETARMVSAWTALDKAAEAAGAQPLDPVVWELALEDGTAVAIVRDASEARAVSHDGRKLAVYSLEEIGRMLTNYREVVDAKLTFPGAVVTAIRHPSDPLDNIKDTLGGLDYKLDDAPALMAG